MRQFKICYLQTFILNKIINAGSVNIKYFTLNNTNLKKKMSTESIKIILDKFKKEVNELKKFWDHLRCKNKVSLNLTK